MLADPRSPAAEAYRSLAATLEFAYADRQLQTVGITSAAAGEGKSNTTANLAIALAEGGHRVIVIDHGVKIAEGAPSEIARHPEVIRVYFGREAAGA